MAAKDNQVLPSKEQGLFRQVVKYYEIKQYKKALKAADQVLKKYPDHGETLSMKVQWPAILAPRVFTGQPADPKWNLADMIDGSLGPWHMPEKMSEHDAGPHYQQPRHIQKGRSL